MRSLTVRLLLFLTMLIVSTGAFAHDVTITGTQNFSALDGSSSDHDGVANGVFTVSDGNLVVNGVVNCNDDTTTSACAMAFVASGNITVNAGGALYAENRSGGGTGGAISLTAGGNVVVNGGGLVSSSSKSSSGATGGNISATAGGAISIASGGTIDAGSTNAQAGKITLTASGLVSVDGNVLSGPSRTLLATRLTSGAALDGGTSNQVGGEITIASTSFIQPAVVIGSNASVVSQGETNGAGPVTITGCGIEVRGLVAALAKKDAPAKVSIRSGQGLLVDGRDLGVAGATLGRTARVRADAPTGTAAQKGVDLFAAEGVQVLGPAAASSTLYVITSMPGLHDSKSYGGRIRIMSTGNAVTASGNVSDSGRSNSGDTGGTIEISASDDVNLATAVIRAVGDFNTNNPNRGGGSISVRSHSGNVVWTNGVGEVRPTGSNSGLPSADQGVINLTACGTVTTTGTSFPVMGTPTFVFPNIQTGVCSPGAPSLPAGVPPFVTCNNPPVANDATASTNEDQSVTITLSGSDVDGDPLTFSIVSGPSNGSLGAIVPVNSTSATVVYTPNANYNGGDSFVYQANDGNGGTDNATVTITITAVNDAPSFQAGTDVTSLEDAGAQTVNPWASSISAGPADESGQTVTFSVTGNSNPSLFSVAPAVSSTGVLTYTAAANAHGSATITIVAQDNGGTANGGADTSASQSFTITITPVNDAPSFTAGADQTVNEDSGAHTVAGWATAISAGPNESGQTLTFNVTANSNPSLFSAGPAVAADGTLSYTLAANAHGAATISITLSDDGGTANGGSDTSAPQSFTITVNSVNDAPTFVGGGDVSALEDSGAQTVSPWATSISAGPADEAGQTLTFSITSNSNPSLFSAGPSIAADGTLTYTPAANAFGSATITVVLSDNGGTANGGADTSATDSFTITIDPVNDVPTFTAGGDVTVTEDSGAYTAPWATGISAGPNEGGQTVTFNVSNSNSALFSAQPSISAGGVLTFTPAANAFGTVTVTVSLSDNGGTANGGVDTSAPVTFTITINGVNDAPMAGNDAWETEGNTELRVDLAAGSTPHVADATGSGTGVLDNDADAVEGDSFSITSIVGCADTTAPFDCTFGDGSKLSMQANGSFSFVPGPGATSGSFQYVVTDNPAAGVPASATGTVTITVHDEIWYVKGGAVGGNGTSVAPFGDFTALDGGSDVDAPGAYIFVHTSNVAGSIALEANQRLWGEGVGLVINRNLNGNGAPATLVAPGVRPTVTSSGDTVSVSNVTGVEVAGLNLSSGIGNAIDVTSSPLGSNAASASIYGNVVLAAGAEGIDVNGGGSLGTTVNVNNTSITSTGTGFNATSMGGNVAVSFSNGTITSLSGNGVSIDGSAGGNLFVTGLNNVTVSGNTSSDGIRVVSATFDAVPGGAFNVVSGGNVVVGAAGNGVGAAGVVLSNVSGAYALGSLSAWSDNGAAAAITGSGSGFTVTSGGGTLSAVNGAGLSVANATIGAANLSFTSISSTGAVNGIVLNSTGPLGGLVVTGSGSAGSGGTIQSTSGNAVSLTSTRSTSLSYMNILNAAHNGVFGTDVANFSFLNGTINGAGVAAAGASREGGIAFNQGVSFTEKNLTGTVVISGSTLSNIRRNAIDITNWGGTLDSLTIANNAVTSSTSASSSLGHAIFVSLQGSASGVASMTAANITNNQISNFPSGSGIVVTGGTPAASAPFTLGVPNTVNAITISGNSIAGASALNRMGSNAIMVSTNGCNGQANFVITNNGTAANPLTNFAGIGISHFIGGSINARTLIDGNVIVANNTAGSAGIATQVDQSCGVTDTAFSVVTITNNSVSNTEGNGIRGLARASNGTLKMKVANNTVGAATLANRNGIRVDSGSSTGNVTLCLEVTNNVAAGSGVSKGIGLRKQGTNAAVNAFGVVGMAATSSPGVETYVDSQNPAGGGTELLSATTGFSSCVFP